jgi:hypothetical protein
MLHRVRADSQLLCSSSLPSEKPPGAKAFVLVSAVAVLLFVCMSSCSGPHVLVGGFAGRWIPEEGSLHWIKNNDDRSRCQIVATPDGNFIATVPDYMLDTFDRCSGSIRAGKGRWSLITEHPETAYAETSVKLTFSELDGKRCDSTAKRLYACGDERLMFYVGDPDSGWCFVFERVDRFEATPSPGQTTENAYGKEQRRHSPPSSNEQRKSVKGSSGSLHETKTPDFTP